MVSFISRFDRGRFATARHKASRFSPARPDEVTLSWTADDAPLIWEADDGAEMQWRAAT